jgi:hypothetical protein
MGVNSSQCPGWHENIRPCLYAPALDAASGSITSSAGIGSLDAQVTLEASTGRIR